MASDNIVVAAAKTGKQVVSSLFESTKEFLNELVHPNMTIEKIAEVATPRLDDIIEDNEENGLKYAAGKFKVAYLDDEHFGLAFEMYFKDANGKWFKTDGASEPRDAELLDVGSWKTLQVLKSVEFPISAPVKEDASDKKADQTDEAQAGEVKLIEEKRVDALAHPTDDKPIEAQQVEVEPLEEKPIETKKEAKSDIDLKDLLAAMKEKESKISMEKK